MVVGEQSVIRWAIRRLLEEEGMLVVGEADSLAEAVKLSSIQEPDVVMIDLQLDNNGIDITRKLAKDCGRRVLALTSDDDQDGLDEFIAAGGKGLVLKTSPVKEIPTAIRAVADNRVWISPSISSSSKRNPQRGKDEQVLSNREREVAILIAKGLSSSQAASKLYVSLNTIETHRYRIFRKLGIHSRAELVDYVIKQGLITRR